ncbi:MAG: hypothetical protein PHX80_05320 [Candidatus Nanoarchaeia archaeon]|nr:hypothetical protein [Candidatus Nanoarchaeia archaeon]
MPLNNVDLFEIEFTTRLADLINKSRIKHGGSPIIVTRRTELMELVRNYVKEKCKEQRKICAENLYNVKLLYKAGTLYEIVFFAPEPKLDSPLQIFKVTNLLTKSFYNFQRNLRRR